MKFRSLVLVALFALMMSSCQSTSNTALKDTQWLLETINGQPVNLPKDAKAYLLLMSTEAHYSAMAGCNIINGGYEATDSAVKFTTGVTTMMACENMETEQTFNATLATVDAYKIEGDVLNLLSGGKTVISFKAQSVK